jgi:nitroimidazol reductase NimA-like FMN-containing flavoprotein (pyridoxamine 5'-phosphate oxidase superfamily)
MPVTMTREEREQFLGGVHVGVLSVALVDGGGPLAVPVWYSYQPGGTVNVITGGSTRKAAANPTGGQIVVRMTPEHWLTVDYGKVYGRSPVRLPIVTKSLREAALFDPYPYLRRSSG